MFDATEPLLPQLDIDLLEMFPTCADSELLPTSPENPNSVVPTTPTFADLVTRLSPQPLDSDLSHFTSNDLSFDDICNRFDAADRTQLDTRPSETESHCDAEEHVPRKLSEELKE